MPDIPENLSQIRQEIMQAAKKANRDYNEIKLLAVSKTVPVETIKTAIAAGIRDFGENKVQELVSKIPQLPPDIQWHLIGHLQTNKVKNIIDKVVLIHSLDTISLAQEISKRGAGAGIEVQVLVEVNVGGEATKHGLSVNETKDFIAEVSQYSNIRIKGLMTVAPYVPNPEEVRPVFRQLRSLADDIRQSNIPGINMDILSMGMSGDFTVAIEEGANIVRVGSRIFGERIY